MSIVSKIVFLGLGWAIGIICSTSFYAGSLLVFLCGYLFFKTRKVGVVFMVFIAFVCGFLRIYLAQNNGLVLADFGNKNIVVYGVISEEIVNYDSYSMIKIIGDMVEYNGSVYKMDFLLTIRANLHSEFGHGDYIRATGTIGNFNIMSYPDVKVLKKGSAGPVLLFRAYIISKLENIFSEPYSSFVSALLIGARKGIPSDILSNFNKIGLTHIIAISGYNITIVIACVFAIFSFLGRKLKVAFSILFVIFFMFLAGASASVVRASLMGIISMLALFLGRKNFIQIAIFASMFFMTFINPEIVNSDVGFQLSFLATLSLIYLMPVLQKVCEKFPEFFGIRDIFLATIASQFFTLPVILMNFNRVSVIAPVANIFILPLIPTVMLFSFIAFVLGVIYVPLGVVFGLICVAISKFIFLLAENFARLEFSYFDLYVTSKTVFIVLFAVVVYIIAKVELDSGSELSGNVVSVKP
jgi:competence protein ComEC